MRICYQRHLIIKPHSAHCPELALDTAKLSKPSGCCRNMVAALRCGNADFSYLPLGETTVLSLLILDMIEEPKLGLIGCLLLGGLSGNSLLSLNGGSCCNRQHAWCPVCVQLHVLMVPGSMAPHDPSCMAMPQCHNKQPMCNMGSSYLMQLLFGVSAARLA